MACKLIKIYGMLLVIINYTEICLQYNFQHDWDPAHSKYSYFSESERLKMREASRDMFQFGYDSYMKYAFPEDELDPIHCRGRGPDYENPDNININDVLGDYSLSLVESLGTLAVLGNSTEFKRAVKLVMEYVSFNKNNTVQVFEANIRILGSLLSAHLIIIDPRQPLGNMTVPNYNNDLLELAHDLASRLLPAFSNTATGIPYPRVSLMDGVPSNCVNETCTSGAGTLVLEFGVLSRLLKDPVYEAVARRAVTSLWRLRSNVTGLLGSVINIQTGEWTGIMSGLGAGIDSFFEYLLKAYILFGDSSDLKMFKESYETIKYHLRRGRSRCNSGDGNTPLYVNVNMKTGDTINTWIDALQAAWSAVQVLHGDIEEAICSHAVYYAIWKRYGALPERYNWQLKKPDVRFYPLRPELIESTYFLYRATKNPFYLHVGKDILESINEHAKERCGYCTIHDVHTKQLEDRMESFFLSETCKYLYLEQSACELFAAEFNGAPIGLPIVQCSHWGHQVNSHASHDMRASKLFDTENPVNQHFSQYIFTTEGHILPLDTKFHQNVWDSEDNSEATSLSENKRRKQDGSPSAVNKAVITDARTNISDCEVLTAEQRYNLPILSRYLTQLEVAVGLRDGAF